MTWNLISLDTSSIIATWEQTAWLLWSMKNTFHLMKNRDFSILKYALIWILILIPIVLIFMLLTKKLTLFNMWFWEGYWLRLITWEFGAGKTKNVFQSAYLRKKLNPHGILISNINYDFVDFYFNSKKDFDFILRDLVAYIHRTNNLDDLKKSIDFPPIKIIVDEAHLYLFSRDFKWFTKDILLVLTQCRKRDISVDFITQELWQIDVFIRRLCPYIEYFEKLPLWLSRQSILYSLDVEWTSMKNEEMFEEVESSILLPFSRWPIFNKKVKDYYAQKYLTKFVIGYENVRYSDEDNSDTISKRYPEFEKKMLENLEDYRKPKLKKIWILDKILLKINDKSNKNKNEHVLNSRIKFNSSYINDFKSYLWDEKFSSILNNAWFTSVSSDSDSKLNILNTQEKMINLLIDSVSESDLTNINNYSSYLIDQFYKFKWFLVHRLSNSSISLCWDEYDEYELTFYTFKDWSRFDEFKIDEMYKYILDHKLYLEIPKNELVKFDKFVQESENNIQIIETL